MKSNTYSVETDINKILYRLVECLKEQGIEINDPVKYCLLYTSPSPRDLSTSRMPSSA